MLDFEVSAAEANRWWQTNTVAGVLLNRLMLLFIVVPIGLVFMQFYRLSFVVFAFMVPYGFFVRYIATRAVRQYLLNHPEALDEFRRQGVITG